MLALTVHIPELLTLSQSLDRVNQTLLMIGKNMTEDVKALVDEVAEVKRIAGEAVAAVNDFLTQLASIDPTDKPALQQATQDLKDAMGPLAAKVEPAPPAPAADNPS